MAVKLIPPQQSLLEHPRTVILVTSKDYPNSLEKDEFPTTPAAIKSFLKSQSYEVIEYSDEELDKVAAYFNSNKHAIVWNAVFRKPGEKKPALTRFLYEHNIPYVGNPPETSSLTTNKRAKKELAQRLGLNTPKEYNLRENEPVEYPVIVKPLKGSMSIDVRLLPTKDQLDKTLVEMTEAYGKDFLVEEYIEGREFRVPVIGWNESDTKALLPVEVVFKEGPHVYDYRDKLTQARITSSTEATGIPPTVISYIKKAAVKVHKAINATGMTRIDFRVAPDNKAYFLEANSSPGLKEHSPVVYAWTQAGGSYSSLIERLLEGSWKYWKDQQENG